MNDPQTPKDEFKITSSALSLTVENVAASSQFLRAHFGFQEKMAAEGFASLVRDDTPLNIIFLQCGIEVLPENLRQQRAAGVIVAFVVTDIEAQQARLKRKGVAITLPLKTEPWGERLFQVADPNGVVYELVEWVKPEPQ